VDLSTIVLENTHTVVIDNHDLTCMCVCCSDIKSH